MEKGTNVVRTKQDCYKNNVRIFKNISDKHQIIDQPTKAQITKIKGFIEKAIEFEK